MNYYKNKEKAMVHAKQVVFYTKKLYSKETEDSSNRTVCLWEMKVVPSVIPRVEKTDIVVAQQTTADAIFAEKENNPYVCALNFASYKQPGGMFLEGSIAQEESLCHEGNLYNILSSERLRELFYAPHRNNLNRGLYYSDLLYTPDVLFIREKKLVKANIITCAAPNAKVAKQYQGISDDDVSKAMRHRIDSILYVAAIMENEVLILGAFGCGVFKNDIKRVSQIFRELLYGKYAGRFKHVVFAVPDDASYCTMKEILS